ncbi:hypothetical protein DFQ26_002867 [Actinomortierella ambigua]|nr:hypothetical protein DFQ26_002867 [Actinomortierella ambigua]
MAHAYSHGNCIHLDNGNTSMRTGLTPWSIRQQLDAPVTVLAKKHNLTTFPAPERRTGIEAWKFPKLDGVDGWDFGVVVSFGWFLPNDIISQFKKAGVNVHPSLLPK